MPDKSRISQFALAIETLFGVLPITVVGGFYALMGTAFGVVSVLVSIYERSWSASLFWLGILAFALGGLIGITGLWLLVVVSELGGTRTIRTVALTTSAAGVVTATVALALAVRDDALRWTTIYLLVSPIVVACHRAYQVFHPPGRLSVYS